TQRHGARHLGLTGPHWPLTFAALMIGHHFSISAFWRVASASGVCCSRGGTSSPSSAKRRRTAGSAKVSTTAALRLPTISFGVLLGTPSPYQTEAWKPCSPASSTVATSGALASLLPAATA